MRIKWEEKKSRSGMVAEDKESGNIYSVEGEIVKATKGMSQIV